MSKNRNKPVTCDDFDDLKNEIKRCHRELLEKIDKMNSCLDKLEKEKIISDQRADLLNQRIVQLEKELREVRADLKVETSNREALKKKYDNAFNFNEQRSRDENLTISGLEFPPNCSDSSLQCDHVYKHLLVPMLKNDEAVRPHSHWNDLIAIGHMLPKRKNQENTTMFHIKLQNKHLVHTIMRKKHSSLNPSHLKGQFSSIVT